MAHHQQGVDVARDPNHAHERQDGPDGADGNHVLCGASRPCALPGAIGGDVGPDPEHAVLTCVCHHVGGGREVALQLVT